MDGIIRVKNTSYSYYEELLLRRDSLKKEAFISQRNYTAEFGDRIVSVFEKKIECIRKKKTIEYCQAAENHGEKIDQQQLYAYIEAEMADFQRQLEDMIKDTESAKNRGEISEIELIQIKKIYHKIAKTIHPDINSETAKSEELLDLWQRVTAAYDCNQLEELQELEILVAAALRKVGLEKIDVDIPNIEDKIAELETEIKKIKETDPYMYKFLLEDVAAVAEKRAELKEELKLYTDYSEQLEKILHKLLGNGERFIWRMN